MKKRKKALGAVADIFTRIIRSALTPKPFINLKCLLGLALIAALGVDVIIRIQSGVVESVTPSIASLELIGPGAMTMICTILMVIFLVGANMILRIRHQRLQSKLLDLLPNLSSKLQKQILEELLPGAYR